LLTLKAKYIINQFYKSTKYYFFYTN